MIYGLPRAGVTVHATAGTWSPKPDVYRYEWRLDGELIHGALHQIADDDLNAQVSNLRDIPLLARIGGFNSAGAQQHADLGALHVLRFASEIAQHRQAELSGAEDEDVLGRSVRIGSIHRVDHCKEVAPV